MRKISFLVIICLLQFSVWAQNFKLIASDESKVIVAHQLSKFKLTNQTTDNQTYADFSSLDPIFLLEKGAPQVPVYSRNILIPATGNSEITVTYDNYYELSNISILPSKGNLKRNVNPSEVPYEFGEVYNQNAFYPGKLAELSSPFIARDLRGQTITFFPFQYNPVTKILRIYENLRVEVKNKPNEPSVNEFKLKNTPKETKGLFKSQFLNGFAQEKYAPKEEDGELLLICPESMIAQAKEIAAWKNQKGIKTHIITTEITGKSTNNVKTYIADMYASNPDLLYVIFIGDHADIPAYSYGTSGGEELYSDTYYAQLTGSDYYPELFVGRLSGNETQVSTMIQRSMEYEKNPLAGDWMMRAIGLGSAEGTGIGDDGEQDWKHLRNIRTELTNFGYSVVHEFYDGSQGQNDEAGNPTPAMISSALNQGVGLFNYTGHGDLNICVSGNFTSTNINALTNQGKYPFVVSVACNNGTYIYGNCISEAWLRASKNDTPTGAIAACGSSILMAWAQPMQTQDEMTSILTEAYASNRKTTLGGLFYNAQMSMLEKYPSGDGIEVMQTWVFFGDPSIQFRNKTTQELTANHPAFVPISTSELSVYSNIEGADVAISRNNLLLGKGKIAGGVSNIQFPALQNDSTLLVTVTKQNFKSYQGEVNVGNSNNTEKPLIYPNPSNGSMKVSFVSTSEAIITLSDVTGKIVREYNVPIGVYETEINKSDLSSGIYNLTYENSSNKWTQKVIFK